MGNLSVKEIVFGLLVLLYTILSIILFNYHIRFEDAVRLIGVSKRHNSHGLLALTGLFILGLGLMIFRFFNGAPTRVVKYAHMVIQSAATVCLVLSTVCASNQGAEYGDYMPLSKFNTTDERYGAEYGQHMDGGVHNVLGYMTVISILLQFVIGITILAYMYPNTKLRRNFAPFHDIFGIWIYISVVCCYLTGIFALYDGQLGCCGAENDAMNFMQDITPPTYLSTLIVLGALLSPFFEWDLVGPI